MSVISPTLPSDDLGEDLPSDSDTVYWGRLCSNNRLYKTVDLSENEYTIGRDDTNSIAIPDTIVSGLHCKIARVAIEGGMVPFIFDFSTNGTRVDGKVIGKGKSRPLSDLSEIVIAKKKNNEENISFTYRQILAKDNALKEKYTELPKILGSGAFGVVKLIVENEKPNRYFALKEIDKKAFESQAKGKSLFDEVTVMEQLDHENIIKVVDTFENETTYMIVLEYANGGTLFDLVRTNPLSEAVAREYFKPIVEAVGYIHGKKMAHRDLKPQNVLLIKDKFNNPTIVKLADFGLSREVGEDSNMMTKCGTPEFIAPEIVFANRQGYTNKVDVWSLGCILYHLLSSHTPFEAKKYRNLAEERLKNGIFDFDDPVWKKVSENAKDLIRQMLALDPTKRPSCKQILEHNWVLNCPDANHFSQKRERESGGETENEADTEPDEPNNERIDKNYQNGAVEKHSGITVLQSDSSDTIKRLKVDESLQDKLPKKNTLKQDSESPASSEIADELSLPLCMYGSACTRINSVRHKQRFRH